MDERQPTKLPGEAHAECAEPVHCSAWLDSVELEKRFAREMEWEAGAELPAPYYDAEGVTLYHGSCEHILRYLAPVDIVVTSPPYNTLPTKGKASGLHAERKTGRNLWMERAAGGYEEYGLDEIGYQLWLERVMMQCARTARGVVWMNHKTRWRDGAGIHPLDFLRGMALTHEIVWDRGISMALNAKRFAPSHEYIFGFGKAHYWCDDWNTKMSVWRLPPCVNRNGDGHPCPFPEPLIAPLIQASCPPGGVVLDPFAGSGTTLRVAKDLGRRAIGIEKEERYCEMIVNRLAQSVLSLGAGEGDDASRGRQTKESNHRLDHTST